MRCVAGDGQHAGQPAAQQGSGEDRDVLPDPDGSLWRAVLVIGGTGFTGPRLIRQQIARGENIVWRSSRRSPAGKGRLIDEFDVSIVPFERPEGDSSFETYQWYGKHHGPDPLNLRDCAAYALARTVGASSLFKGADCSTPDILSGNLVP
jgi:uncharacterized protein with PIN domain